MLRNVQYCSPGSPGTKPVGLGDGVSPLLLTVRKVDYQVVLDSQFNR